MGIGQRLVIAACLVEAAAFAPPRRAASPASTVVRRMGMFDFFKPTMGEDQAWKDEQLQAQREILERRRSKDKRQKYMEKVEAGRRKRDAEVNMWKFQQDKTQDPLIGWKKLREQGKIKDLKREKAPEGAIPLPMASFGVPEYDEGGRFDLRLPYVDQGWVDEDADVMGNLFGGKKKKPPAKSAPKSEAPKAEPGFKWPWE